LDKKGRWDLLMFFFRLLKVLRDQAPDVIYSFLGVANILAVLFRPLIPVTKVVWGVRASNMDLNQYDRVSRFSYWFECQLSRLADKIIANSHAGLEYAVEHGFPEKNITVIHNGIDTDKMISIESAGKLVRKSWGIEEDEFLIGVVGRIDPMKGLPTFLDAAVRVKKQYPKVRFVWVGEGEDEYEKAMRELATKLELDDVLTWAGLHRNMVTIYNAFDIASSSSFSEGFSNVLGEAMACGIPCVCTDVGDSALVVGDSGSVVAAKNSKALSLAWGEMLSLNDFELKQLSVAARNRVVNEFSVKVLLEKTEKVLLEGVV